MEPTTGYEHVPTAELATIWRTLQEVKPKDAAHAAELQEDIELLNAEIAKRV